MAHPGGQQRLLGVGQRGLREQHDLMAGQVGRCNQGRRVGDGELVEPLGAQDLGVVAAERVVAVGDHQDRPFRPGIGRGPRGGRERPPRDAAGREEDAARDGDDESDRQGDRDGARAVRPDSARSHDNR